MNIIKTYIVVGCSLLLFGCFVAPGISEEELGLRKSTIYNETDSLSAAFEYNQESAGSSKLIERADENAPPMIPHDVSDILPAVKDNSMCVLCHIPE